jgi:hypothetical protein
MLYRTIIYALVALCLVSYFIDATKNLIRAVATVLRVSVLAFMNTFVYICKEITKLCEESERADKVESRIKDKKKE